YWLAKGVDWKIMTQKELSRQLAKNIEWVRETLYEEGESDIELNSLRLRKFLLENQQLLLRGALKLFDEIEGLEKGTALFLFRRLIMTHQIKVDMFKK